MRVFRKQWLLSGLSWSPPARLTLMGMARPGRLVDLIVAEGRMSVRRELIESGSPYLLSLGRLLVSTETEPLRLTPTGESPLHSWFWGRDLA